jgi:AraC-like DNA-binding protein
MNISLNFPDIFLFAAIILLVLNAILLLIKINKKNYILIGSLSMYFIFITTTVVLIMYTRFNTNILNNGIILTLITIVYSLYNVFHYFSLQQLIVKKNQFNFKYILHLVAILILGGLILYFFKPIYNIEGKGYDYIYESQLLMKVLGKNYILFLIRIIHPIFYFILGGYLLILFYNSPRYLSIPKSTRNFIFFFYFQKILMFVFVLIGFVGFDKHIMVYTNFSKTSFSITALFMSSYILLRPNLLLQITKLNHTSKKSPLEASKLTDLFSQLEQIMEQNKLYLDANYTLTNLSSDTDIPINIIREIITTNGYKNFSAFINSFRIAHAEQLISNGYLDKYSIESLCKDSGFQSEVTFYRVFKKLNNCTPKEFSHNLRNFR